MLFLGYSFLFRHFMNVFNLTEQIDSDSWAQKTDLRIYTILKLRIYFLIIWCHWIVLCRISKNIFSIPRNMPFQARWTNVWTVTSKFYFIKCPQNVFL